MDVKQLLGAITGTILKVVIAAVVIIFVYKGAVAAYDFGFQVFADIPVSEGEGRTVNVIISDKQSVKDVGKLLEEKGLIRNAKAFVIQEKFSDNKNGIQPGTYELNTAMNVEEILDILYATTEGETEEEVE